VSTSSSPLVERRRLQTELRKAREDAALTQEAVAERMDWSVSKIIRIEAGSVGISTNDLNALLRLYNIGDSRRVKELIELGRASRKQTWWSKYRSWLPPTYFKYIEYETSATIIRSYETLVIPGLLQTREYATKVGRLYKIARTDKQVQNLVEIRMKRQELLLDRPKPPLLFLIFDEAVISRLAGDKEVQRGQLEKLLVMARMPTITVEIVPFNAGLHQGMGENFSILEFGPADSDVIYFENARDAILSRDETEDATIYRELFEDLRKVSLGPQGTIDYLIDVQNKT
jgi:transcriptional regulator with XRE-family HTH domain